MFYSYTDRIIFSYNIDYFIVLLVIQSELRFKMNNCNYISNITSIKYVQLNACIYHISTLQEVQEITDRSQQICSVITQIRDTFHSLFEQPSHVVPLRQNKRSKHTVVMRHHNMSIGMKIKFELYGEPCINWLKNTIKLIKVSI